MDDLTLMREFRAERAAPDPKARADAWRVLEARIQAEGASASFVEDALPRPRRASPSRSGLSS